MPFLKSIVLAFSMFSRIPMPRVAWNSRNLRYLLCAFPLVGVVEGLASVAWGALALFVRETWQQSVGVPLVALGFVLIPVLITGGIHLDGFMDTLDALSSNADREKKLAIMKDPHAGSFAVLGCVLYILTQFVLMLAVADCALVSSLALRRAMNRWQQVRLLLPLVPLFVLSRLLSAFAVATFPIAKDSGLVRTFSDASARRFTAVWCGAWFVAVSAASVLLGGTRCAVVPTAELSVFAWYYVKTKRAFGGITGDTAGWFVQLAELCALAALAAATGLR